VDENKEQALAVSRNTALAARDEHHNTVSQMIQVIERVAMNPDVDVVKMEKLLDMQERILDRQTRQEFDMAMSKMQPKLPVITKAGVIMNKDEKTVRSTYAKFEDINKKVKPILSKYGFSMTFGVTQENNEITVTANLAHKAGHRESTQMTLPPDGGGGKSGPQAIASSVSYAKRYTMSALLNLIFDDEDDDCQSGPVSVEQLQSLAYVFTQVPDNVQKWIIQQYGDLAKMPACDYELRMGEMKARIRKNPGNSSRLDAMLDQGESNEKHAPD